MPTTGVFSQNSLEWLPDSNDSDVINAGWLDVVEQHEEESHAGQSCDEVDCREIEMYDFDESELLVGFVRNEETGLYEEDPGAEWSGIVSCGNGCPTVQVTRSQWGLMGAACSPCYPGQVDAETEGSYVAYSVPPDVVGDRDDELKSRIRPIAEILANPAGVDAAPSIWHQLGAR